METNSLTEFKNENKWNRASNYIGQSFEGYICGPVTSRDADLVARSNFAAALEMLGGETETVIVSRSSHWACGWVEQILVHESDVKAIAVLKDISDQIADYPLLDEGSYFELQREERQETIALYWTDFVSELSSALGLDEDPTFESDSDFQELASYIYEYDCDYRGDEDAWVRAEDLPGHLESMRSHFYSVIEQNPWFEYACVAMGLEESAS